MINDADLDNMLQTICARPRMYCSSLETGRDLIFFLFGVHRGAVYPAHGTTDGWNNEEILTFREYVYRRFDRTPPWPGFWRDGEFLGLLLEEFGEKPCLEVCVEIGNLFRGIREPDGSPNIAS